MRVPLLDLSGQYNAIREDVSAAIVRVCESQRFIGGPEVDAFEREIAAQLGVAHAVGMSSGTDALLAALMAVGVGPGDEIVTSAYSFFATAGCIVRLGALPKFVDIDPSSFNLDAAQIDGACTAATKAIVPVHLFGQVADMDAVGHVARRRGIAVIEDAAQAIGATRDGRGAGTIGTLGAFSFFPSKNLGAFGDAGMTVTNDGGLADRLRILRDHGAQSKYHHKIVGGNFRLDAIQAAVLRVKARHLAAWTEGRRRNAQRYRELLHAAGADRYVQLPREQSGCFHIYNQFVILTPRRDEVRAYLRDRGIDSEVYYPIPLHLQECFRAFGYREGDFPGAEAAARSSLALPIYPELRDEQLQYVAAAIAGFFGLPA